MAGRRQAIELAIGEEDLAALGAIASSRTEAASRVERARMLLAYRDDRSFFAVGRALAYGAMAALGDRPRPGREATITAEAKAWVVDIACRKAKDLGYPHELWTTPSPIANSIACRRPAITSNLASESKQEGYKPCRQK